jgi:hypothetical protein
MDTAVYLDHYLQIKRQQRQAVFEDAASSSLLMGGVLFLYKHSQVAFNSFCRLYMSVRLRLEPPAVAEESWKAMDRFHADAIDTYHLMWVTITVVCYSVGWQLYDPDVKSWREWVGWSIALALCLFRMFDISAALVEMYFGGSEARHHQFRILLHAGLHFLCIGFAFALFYIFADWGFGSFGGRNADKTDYPFNDWSDAVFASLETIFLYGGNQEPKDGFGKLLTLLEILMGFMLATLIFLNITQIWVGSKKDR